MKKIVVFGSINTDLAINSLYFPNQGETVKGSNFSISQGGKGANQAVAASRLGAKVDFVGCVGDDPFGEKCLRNISNENISPKYIRKIFGTPTAVAIILKANNDNRIILDSGANEHLSLEDLNNYILNNIVTDSIFITQLENKIEVNFQAIKLAKMHNMITIFNPAPASKIPVEIYSLIDYLVVNQSEAKILSGIYPLTNSEAEEVYNELKKYGLKNLIITLGVLGSIVFTENEVRRIDPFEVKVVDTTGAGDAYIGALAYMLAIGKDIISACKFANIVAGVSCTKKGAQGGLPTLDEVNVFLRSVNNGF